MAIGTAIVSAVAGSACGNHHSANRLATPGCYTIALSGSDLVESSALKAIELLGTDTTGLVRPGPGASEADPFWKAHTVGRHWERGEGDSTIVAMTNGFTGLELHLVADGDSVRGSSYSITDADAGVPHPLGVAAGKRVTCLASHAVSQERFAAVGTLASATVLLASHAGRIHEDPQSTPIRQVDTTDIVVVQDPTDMVRRVQ